MYSEEALYRPVIHERDGSSWHGGLGRDPVRWDVQVSTGGTPVPRWLRGVAVPAMRILDRSVNFVPTKRT